jgi:nucleotide-binding universal stress UspA family protein
MGMRTTHRQIVVACDFSEHGRAVLDRAVAQVAGAPGHILHVVTVLDPRAGLPAVPTDGPIDFAYAERVREYMAACVSDAFQAVPGTTDVQFFLHPRIGGAVHEILDLARDVGADLILIGTHGFTGLKHMVMGSVAERVVREAGCPVTVVREKSYPEVELEQMVEIPAHKRPTSRLYLFSYTNSNVIMRPPDWPIH